MSSTPNSTKGGADGDAAAGSRDGGGVSTDISSNRSLVRSRFGAALGEIADIVIPSPSSTKTSPLASPRTLMAAERRAGGEVALKSFDKILASVAAKQKKMRLHIRTGPPGSEDELLAQKSKGGGSPTMSALSAVSMADAMGFRRAEDDIEALRRRVQRRDEMISLLRRQLAQEAAPLYKDSDTARQESRFRIRDRIKDDALLMIELEEETELLYRIVDAKDRALEQFKQRVMADAGRIKGLNERIERLLVESSERIRTLEYEKRGHLVALQGKDRLLERYQTDRTTQNERILLEEVRYKELEEEKQAVDSKLSVALQDIERLRREVEARDEELRRREGEQRDEAARMDSLTAEYEEVKRRYDELWEKLDSLPPDSYLNNNSYRDTDTAEDSTSDEGSPKSSQRAPFSSSFGSTGALGHLFTRGSAEVPEANSSRQVHRPVGIEVIGRVASPAMKARKTILTSRNRRNISSTPQSKQEESAPLGNSANRINTSIQSFANAFSSDMAMVRWETVEGEQGYGNGSPMVSPSSVPSVEKIASSIPFFSQAPPVPMTIPPIGTTSPSHAIASKNSTTTAAGSNDRSKRNRSKERQSKSPKAPSDGRKESKKAPSDVDASVKQKPETEERPINSIPSPSKKNPSEAVASGASKSQGTDSTSAKLAEELHRTNVSLSVRIAALEATLRRVEAEAKADEKYFSNKLVNLTVENERLVAEQAAIQAKAKADAAREVKMAQHERDELQYTVNFLSEQLAQYMGAYQSESSLALHDKEERGEDADLYASAEESKTILLQFSKSKGENNDHTAASRNQEDSGATIINSMEVSTAYDVIVENLSESMNNKPASAVQACLNAQSQVGAVTEDSSVNPQAQVAGEDGTNDIAAAGAIERPESQVMTSRPQSNKKPRPLTGQRSSVRKDASAWSSQLGVLCDSYDANVATITEAAPSAILVHLQNFLVECKALSEVYMNKRRNDEVAEINKVLFKFLCVISDQIDAASICLPFASSRIAEQSLDHEALKGAILPFSSVRASVESFPTPLFPSQPTSDATAIPAEQRELDAHARLEMAAVGRGVLNGTAPLSSLPPERPLSGKGSPPRRLSAIIVRRGSQVTGGVSTSSTPTAASLTTRKSIITSNVIENKSIGFRLPEVAGTKDSAEPEQNNSSPLSSSREPTRWSLIGGPDKGNGAQSKTPKSKRTSMDAVSLSDVLSVSQCASNDPNALSQPDKYRASPRTRKLSQASNAAALAKAETPKDAGAAASRGSKPDNSTDAQIKYVDYAGSAAQGGVLEVAKPSAIRDNNDISLSDMED